MLVLLKKRILVLLEFDWHGWVGEWDEVGGVESVKRSCSNAAGDIAISVDEAKGNI